MVVSGNAEDRLMLRDIKLNFKYSWQAVWFEGSNLTLEEILKLTYWWCRDVQQETMRFEADVSGSTVVDWDSFCREVCGVNYSACRRRGGVLNLPRFCVFFFSVSEVGAALMDDTAGTSRVSRPKHGV